VGDAVTTIAPRVREVARKKPETKTRQLNVRVPVDIADRLEAAATMLATDASHLLRLILVEKLPEYEERGRRARGLSAPGEGAEKEN
jgi:hypothetical protein